MTFSPSGAGWVKFEFSFYFLFFCEFIMILVLFRSVSVWANQQLLVLLVSYLSLFKNNMMSFCLVVPKDFATWLIWIYFAMHFLIGPGKVITILIEGKGLLGEVPLVYYKPMTIFYFFSFLKTLSVVRFKIYFFY